MTKYLKIEEELSELDQIADFIFDYDNIMASINQEARENKHNDSIVSEQQKHIYLRFISVEKAYQYWYIAAGRIIKSILPEHYDEFCRYYHDEKKSKSGADSFTISDYLHTLDVDEQLGSFQLFNPKQIFMKKFEFQENILFACLPLLKSKLYDIEATLLSDLYTDELVSAEILLRNGFLRAAGAITGVVLESHLKKVCLNHQITTRKRNLSISDYSQMLKIENILDIPTWRLIQRLADIRNYCDHDKEREPTKDEVEDLLRGTRKIISELF